MSVLMDLRATQAGLCWSTTASWCATRMDGLRRSTHQEMARGARSSTRSFRRRPARRGSDTKERANASSNRDASVPDQREPLLGQPRGDALEAVSPWW